MKKANSLKEAIEILDILFRKAKKSEQQYIKDMLKVEDMIVYHSTIGRQIRNNWGLWEENKNALQIELINFGSGNHADDMSMFILNVFFYYIKSLPNVKIETIINEYITKRLLE